MIENKVCRHFTIGFKGRHYLFPLRKGVTNDNDIIVPPTEIGLHVMKSTPHLVKGPTVMMGKRVGCDYIFLV